ncbi:MAG: EB domain-containing protein, partial [Myxococcota bacterium]
MDTRLVCSAGTCESGPCSDGEEGCSCIEGACNGDALACDGERCISTDCPAGTLGCPCRAGDLCDASGSTCESSVCRAAECSPGELFCSCSAEGDCDSGATCRDGVICVETAGTTGAECRADNTCAAGNQCLEGRCVPCDIGALGCSCFSSGSCLSGGACVDGRCAREPGDVLNPPVVPKCYSPCTEDLVTESGTRLCSPEGLLEGCLAGTLCIDGSCVANDEAPAACDSDIQCPDYQACIAGRCYSHCESDAECPAELACHRKVCRWPCRADAFDCAEGQHCVADDGEVGFCEPMAEAPAEVSRTATGSFELSTSVFEFSNVRSGGAFSITNGSDRALEFVVRKVEHSTRTNNERVFERSAPLPWLAIGAPGDEAQVNTYTVLVDAGSSADVSIANANTDAFSQWQGALVVENPDLGAQQVSLSFVETADGRWSGKLYYFTSFGDDRIEEWLSSGKPSDADLDNAFLLRWASFKEGTPRTLEEWNAILAATQTGSWATPATLAACEADNQIAGVRCYPWQNAAGVRVYTDDISAKPIPTGVVDFPVSVHLAAENAAATRFLGRIHTPGTLHYAGNPALRVSFAGPTDTCTAINDDTCIVELRDFSSTIVVGGRRTAVGGGCDSDQSTSDTPWLVDGFDRDTVFDETTGGRFRRDCLDNTTPFTVEADEDAASANASLARSNPVPDGLPRRRTIELIDGALVNNETLFVIFRETFASFLSDDPNDDFDAYGYMVLTRSAAELELADFVGNEPTIDDAGQGAESGPSCSEDFLATVSARTSLNVSRENLAAQASAIANVALDGTVGSSSAYLSSGRVHYLCASSVPTVNSDGQVTGYQTVGYFDSGPGLASSTAPDVDPNTARSCPAGSTVRYFAYSSAQSDASVRSEACQRSGTCHELFAEWEASAVAGTFNGISLDPTWRCADPDAASCDDNRLDLRAGKLFYEPGDDNAFVPLQPAIEEAFRYRFRFQSRDGSGLGFAPDRCTAGDTLPYCYDPAAIEELEERVDCLTELFTDYHAQLGSSASGVRDYLETNFAFAEAAVAGRAVDGFERLYAELLVMLGDDALTRASAARFDLAAAAVYGFEGSRFEPNGIDLSGGAGYEMYELYRAAQSYELALDRFYRLVPAMWTAINQADGSRNFVTLGTVTSYVDRLIRASSQKSRVWSEIALRYQGFNRADLATRVVERAYSSAYMESVILSHFMLRLRQVVSVADRPQVSEQVRLASLGYRSSLLRMRRVYEDLSADLQFFGYAPDEIPFPVLDPQDTNAFDKVFAIARQKTAVAADKEERALGSNRAYESDSVAFQNELTRIQNTFEDQLVEICGTFVGDDGRVYPAIRQYASASAATAVMGNPCGALETGSIRQTLGDLELLSLELESVLLSARNLEEEIEIEVVRAGQQCNQILTLADFKREQQGEIITLEEEIRQTQIDMARAQRVVNGVVDSLTAGSGGSFLGFGAIGTGVAIGAAHLLNESTQVWGEERIA